MHVYRERHRKRTERGRVREREGETERVGERERETERVGERERERKSTHTPRLMVNQPMRPGRSSQNSFRSRLPMRGFSSLCKG